MKRNTSLFLVIMVLILACTEAYAGVAVITEIEAAGGTAEVRKAGQRDWVKLQSLDQGDVMRASGKAYVVIVSAAGGRALKITAANSPYEVKMQTPQDGKTVKAQIVVNKLMDFMSGKKKESLSMPLAVRSLKRAPGLISPNNSKILSPQPLFEWIGTPRVPYGIKVMLGDALVWQKEKIYRSQIAYPTETKPLVPGRYIWKIETEGYPAVSAWFEIATENERKSLEEEMRLLEEPGFASLPPSTRTMLKYGILVSKGFHAEARNVLLAAMVSNPDVPLLHILLGDFYEYSGLRDLAAEEYDEADFLMRVQQ
jgi:hypothetical protein